MKKFSGIDLHSDNSMVVVSDEEDRIVYQRRLANDLAGIVQALEPHREELIGVVVESTYNWYWLVLRDPDKPAIGLPAKMREYCPFARVRLFD